MNLNQSFSGKAVIIDDQECVRKPLIKLLESAGFTKILTAQDGETGFRIFQREQEDIRVVFLDMVMPGWDGFKTFKALKAIHPHLPIVVMSGYVKEQIDDAFGNHSQPSAFLQKPFDIEAFQKCLSAAMSPH